MRRDDLVALGGGFDLDRGQAVVLSALLRVGRRGLGNAGRQGGDGRVGGRGPAEDRAARESGQEEGGREDEDWF